MLCTYRYSYKLHSNGNLVVQIIMGELNRLDVVLCWHMHQPEYRVAGQSAEPWTYLHALKDYADMAAHLEAIPEARAVVNFTPILLRQLARDAREISSHLAAGDALTEPLLAALAAVPSDAWARAKLVQSCLAVNERTMLGRWPAFAALAVLVRPAANEPTLARYLNDACIADLCVWFHLAWFGEARRRQDPLLQRLIAAGGDFTMQDRRALLMLIGAEINDIVPRYRALLEAGRIELSLTPWGHPILPLLIDITAGQETLPDGPLPEASEYPGGHQRARWHIDHAINEFADHFGVRPIGCWPSEGAISRATLELLEETDFAWTASGAGVLGNAEIVRDSTDDCAHMSYSLADHNLRCFFRDDGLSDLIGFTYQSWEAPRAVDDLISHLENIQRLCPSSSAIVPIILDGENAWEHYPENGFDFLRMLYQRLADHPKLHLTTFAEHLTRNPRASATLTSVKAGSWVYGTLSTWIGNDPRNRAWDLLVHAKQAFDACIDASNDASNDGHVNRVQLEEMLGVCEGSDWFWWLSEHQSASAVARFESLYRQHLTALYRALDVRVPNELAVVLGAGDAHATAASMQRSS